MKRETIQALKKNPFLKGFFLLLPFPLTFVVLACAVVILFETLVVPSPYFRLLTHDTVAPSVTIPEIVIPEDESQFPVIPYLSQWATLNVDGWERKDIKVFFGDTKEILKKGAGMWLNSRFCGQNGKIVLSAHVTTDFHEIEDTPIGAHVTVDTVYGKYVYEVTDTLIFKYTDASPLSPSDGEEVLFMYTCYPRKNGYQFKTERMALICKKIEGKDWKKDE